MLKPVSHYVPSDSHFFPVDDPDGLAYCGHSRFDDEHGRGAPTCPTCADYVDAEDRLDDEIAQQPLPLDAEEAAAALLADVLDKVYAAMGARR